MGGNRVGGERSPSFKHDWDWCKWLDFAIEDATALIMAVEGTDDKLVKEVALLRPEETEKDKLDLKADDNGVNGSFVIIESWVGISFVVEEVEREWDDVIPVTTRRKDWGGWWACFVPQVNHE